MAEIVDSTADAKFQGKTSLFYLGSNWTFAVTKTNQIVYWVYEDVSENPSRVTIQVDVDGNQKPIDAGRGIISATILTGPDMKGLRLYLIGADDYLKEYCLDESDAQKNKNKWYRGALIKKQYEVAANSDLSATPDPIKVFYQAPGKADYLTMAYREKDIWNRETLTNFPIDA